MCCVFMKLPLFDVDDDENLVLLVLLLMLLNDEQVSFFESFHFSSKYNGAGAAPSMILQLPHVDIEEEEEEAMEYIDARSQEQEQEQTDCVMIIDCYVCMYVCVCSLCFVVLVEIK
ncbi:hypothetical protein PIB30_064724 [Stylosanthes scabra]|uniref:Uncharacterized protein n=1 Tax=Stylosanthes scabra TaxID=79078 RepID=A0ABU6VLJ7_9FABA|nr:hypothetical protein [Stylosanthes scabra]